MKVLEALQQLVVSTQGVNSAAFLFEEATVLMFGVLCPQGDVDHLVKEGDFPITVVAFDGWIQLDLKLIGSDFVDWTGFSISLRRWLPKDDYARRQLAAPIRPVILLHPVLELPVRLHNVLSIRWPKSSLGRPKWLEHIENIVNLSFHD